MSRVQKRGEIIEGGEVENRGLANRGKAVIRSKNNKSEEYFFNFHALVSTFKNTQT